MTQASPNRRPLPPGVNASRLYSQSRSNRPAWDVWPGHGAIENKSDTITHDVQRQISCHFVNSSM